MLYYAKYTQNNNKTILTDSVTNPVCGLPPDSHQRSPLHHIDSHTTQHTGLHFPSSTALTTHTQLITLITLTPENYHTITITNHTLFISLGLSLSERRVLYCVYHSHSDSYSIRSPSHRPFLNTKYAKFGLASSVVWTSQVRLGSANSWGRENTSPVILQMEQQCTW